MGTTYYMHTLNGCPAFFGGKQICFMISSRKANPLASSLRQIRQEQRQTSEWRISHGYSDNKIYGYLRVLLPPSPTEGSDEKILRVRRLP